MTLRAPLRDELEWMVLSYDQPEWDCMAEPDVEFYESRLDAEVAAEKADELGCCTVYVCRIVKQKG